jgi:carbamoyl-phosphate synthase large subunit
MPPRNSNIFVSIGTLEQKVDFLPSAMILVALGFNLYGTQGTAKFFQSQDVPMKAINKPSEVKEQQGHGDSLKVAKSDSYDPAGGVINREVSASPALRDSASPDQDQGQGENVVELLKKKMFALVINIPKNDEVVKLTDGYLIRRATVDFGIPLITNIKLANLLAFSLEKIDVWNMPVKSWDEYMQESKRM